jgi:hypothetical protein
VSAFSDPEIIRMAREDYVPVVGDDWYERRRDDTEGRFFRQVADQGPRKGDGGATRQGVYCFTAAGKLLAYSNHSDPQVMRKMIQKGLTAWNQLPETERRPGAIQVEDSSKDDPRYSRQPPPGGLILNVYTRILDHDAKGELCKGACKTLGGDRTARDHLWLTKSDWQSVVPFNIKSGVTFPLPQAFAERLIRFHLVDNTRGEPPCWRPEEIRSSKLSLVVEDVTDAKVRLRLEGSVLLATNANVKQADRGFEVRLLGYLVYDRRQETFDRIDIVALGEHWGEGPFTKGARPGRSPLGIVFELAAGNAPADRVPPQGAREINEYLGRSGR